MRSHLPARARLPLLQQQQQQQQHLELFMLLPRMRNWLSIRTKTHNNQIVGHICIRAAAVLHNNQSNNLKEQHNNQLTNLYI
jgi:hypothetical protein